MIAMIHSFLLFVLSFTSVLVLLASVSALSFWLVKRALKALGKLLSKIE